MGRFTVLLVDDDEVQREYIASKFDRSNFEILQAETARVAVELAAQREIDVLISDYLMPDAVGTDTGLDLLSSIAKTQKKPPLLILTTGFPDLLPPNPYDADRIAVFCKPFDPLELAQMVKKKLGLPAD